MNLSQPARDALTYQEEGGTVKPLSISHKGMFRTLNIFANFCQTSGTSFETELLFLARRILMILDAVRCA